MNEEGNYEGHLRRYLLGELNEEEQQALEEWLFVDDELFDLLSVAEDELIEDYLSGLLSVAECQRFDGFFLSTSDRLRKLNFAKALRRYVTTEAPPATTTSGVIIPATAWWKQPFSIPYLKLAAAALILLALGFGTWRVLFYQSEVSRGLASLAEAYRSERPFEARISGLGYAPLPNTRGRESGNTDYVARDRAEILIHNAVNEHPDAHSLHALGRLYLAKQEFDKAIDQFDKALKLDEKSAELHSDYGAALLEISKIEESKTESARTIEYNARALEHLNRALELDANLLEALFNRALLQEFRSLRQLAEEDWKKYLEKDSNSRWADEARERLRKLEEQKNSVSQTKEELYETFLRAYEAGDRGLAWAAFSSSRVRAGNFILDRLVDDYLEGSSQSPSLMSDKAFRVLSYAGELEFENVRDRFALNLAHFYGRVGPKERSSLREARGLAKAGQMQLAESDFKSAIETYARAKRTFDKSGDACESKSVEYWLAICYQQGIDPQQSSSRLRQVAADCKRDDYKWLVIRSLNGLAYDNARLNEYSRVIEYSSRARELAEQTQDTYGLVLAVLDLIRAYGYLGNKQQAMSYLHRLLDLVAERPMEPLQTCVCYARTAWTLHQAGLEGASLDYQKLALELSLKLNEPTMICTSYVNLGMIQAKLNNFDEALMSVQRAAETATARSSDRSGLLMIAYSELQRGNLHRQIGDLPSAIASYKQSVQLYAKLDFPVFIHEAHKGLVQSYIASGEIAIAKEELQEAIGYYEDHRSKIWEQGNRNTFFDLENDIYDIAIDLESSRMRSPESAFYYSELSRARSLLDLIRKGDHVKAKSPVAQPLNEAQVREKLPEQVQVLQYAVLDDKLLVWFFTRASFKSFEQPIGSKELSERVQMYSALVSTPESDLDDVYKLATELYRLLIGSAEPYLDKGKELFIVADKCLNNIPFQSLVSPATGNFLLEDYRLALSPSSNVLIACSDTARAKAKAKQQTALSLGVSRFDRSEYRGLPDLPSAEREAKEVAGFYTPTSLLTGERATRKDILREIERADVIHLASHFIPSDFSPLKSRLLLARDYARKEGNGIPDNALEAAEIYNISLPVAKLVVLSACRTGIERYYRGEGAISIAHAFLAAGVPLVVASLWAVDSDATTTLMIDLHRNRNRHGVSTIEALRLAELAMLRRENGRYRHPYYWASFNLIGGFADY